MVKAMVVEKSGFEEHGQPSSTKVLSTADWTVDMTVSSVGRACEEPLKSPARGAEADSEQMLLSVWKANCVQSCFGVVAEAGGVGRGV